MRKKFSPGEFPITSHRSSRVFSESFQHSMRIINNSFEIFLNFLTEIQNSLNQMRQTECKDSFATNAYYYGFFQ